MREIDESRSQEQAGWRRVKRCVSLHRRALPGARPGEAPVPALRAQVTTEIAEKPLVTLA
jgi:hypothetical protein